MPHDRAIVEAAERAGLLIIYHNCGLSKVLLELMADTGACVIEPLAFPNAGGDADLAEARSRIWQRVCLRGGLDTEIVVKGGWRSINAETVRCLRPAARDGGYILGPVGPICDAPFANLMALAVCVKAVSPDYI
jgi:uroporphyrinogen-III decarboxylase